MGKTLNFNIQGKECVQLLQNCNDKGAAAQSGAGNPGKNVAFFLFVILDGKSAT